ncbi:hypothetical protein LTR17_018379 [Elasticomyces elasticus]|nr:hypothetical protein LTR17_018379 [Elasticomyces elasticus]
MELTQPASEVLEEQSDFRYRFYETLVLWSVLPWGRVPRMRPRISAWQRFLDDVSYLCDADTGGKSVVSIAVQPGDQMLVFWISANARLGGACQHLCWVLQQLKKLHNGQTSAAETRVIILEGTVNMSSPRVRNYVRALQLHLVQANALKPTTTEELLEVLWQLLAPRQQYAELSSRAYEFRSSVEYLNLKRIMRRSSRVSPWRSIRHYIGRLASWAKCTRFIVEMAQTCQLLHEQHEVRPVRSARRMGWSKSAEAGEGLSVAMNRIVCGDDADLTQTFTAPDIQTMSKNFQARWESLNRRTIVHAEVTMLDHFYRHDLTFVLGERYIGCSKPSCFCCDAYMSEHPLGVLRRPCHGNVWTKWSPPCDDELAKCALVALQEELRRKISRGLSSSQYTARPRRRFDSVTDLSASLPTIYDDWLGDTNM